MAEPVPMCERCLRPKADCGAEQWDNKAVIECRDTELEHIKKQLACAHELVKRSRALLKRTLGQLDQAILTTKPEADGG